MFKYAQKGYGIRILPSYISHLDGIETAGKLKAISRGEKLIAPPYNLDAIRVSGRKWTEKVIERYKDVDYKNTPFHWPEGKYKPIKSDKPVFSHAMLESYAQVTSEPLGRSCLTGWSLLMRHVALWELEREGKITLVAVTILSQC